jgi:hypothetical protein
LLERRNRTVFGMGIDSVAIVVLYGVSIVGLYFLQ